MATVVNPPVPYTAALAGSCQTGTLIEVKGTVNADAAGFQINLKTESGDNAFHFAPRFTEGAVVMNTCRNGVWDREERVSCCGERGAPFDLKILVENDKFMVELNGHHHCHFDYRLKKKEIKSLEVLGDVEISLIREGSSFSSAPIINPPVPYTANIPGGFTAEKMLLVYGVPTGDGVFSINLQSGYEPFKNIGLHLNPRVNSIALNDNMNGSWGAQDSHPFELHAGRAFAIEVVCHDDAFDIRVNGQDVAHFPHRNLDARPLQTLDTLYICGAVDIHLLRI